MRPIETPFQAQLPTSLGVPNYISSGSSWLPHHILFFSLCLKGRYADFELCFIAQNQMQYRNIQYCCYPDFCPLFLHVFLSQICIFIIDLHVHAHTGSKCKNIFLILDHGQNFVSSSTFHTSIHHHHSNPSSQQIFNEPIK